MGGTSRKRTDIWGQEVTDHFDDYGSKTGESRQQPGLFGDYTAHYDKYGSKTGESRQQPGLFGDYTAHYDKYGSKTGESRQQPGLFGDYTAHYDKYGSKTGESRQQPGLFGDYTAHTGSAYPSSYGSPASASGGYGGYSGGVGYSGYSSYSGYGGGGMPSRENTAGISELFMCGFGGSFLVAVVYSIIRIWALIPDENMEILLIGIAASWGIGAILALVHIVQKAKGLSRAESWSEMLGTGLIGVGLGLALGVAVALGAVGGAFYDDGLNPAMRTPFWMAFLVVLSACMLLGALNVIVGFIKDLGKSVGAGSFTLPSFRVLIASILAGVGAVLWAAVVDDLMPSKLALAGSGLLFAAQLLSDASLGKRVGCVFLVLVATLVSPAAAVAQWLPTEIADVLKGADRVLWSSPLATALVVAALLCVMLIAALNGINTTSSAFGLVAVFLLLPAYLLLCLVAGWDHGGAISTGLIVAAASVLVGGVLGRSLKSAS